MTERIPHGDDCGDRHQFGDEVCGCALTTGHPGTMHKCSCGRRWGTVKVTVEQPRTETEQQVLAALTAHFKTTFVADHGDEMPEQFAEDVLAVIQEAGL